MRAQNPLSARQPACEHRRVLCGRSFVVFQLYKFQPIKCEFSRKPQFSTCLNVFSVRKRVKTVNNYTSKLFFSFLARHNLYRRSFSYQSAILRNEAAINEPSEI